MTVLSMFRDDDQPQRSVATRHGIYRKKYALRAVFQSVAFVAIVGGFALYNGMTTPSSIAPDEQQRLDGTRYLKANEESLKDCDDIEKADPAWLTAWYSIGVLYMFLALAIVCDEFFVPALEEMSSPRRLNLSMDVAGATLMAAGGSAPELFSSLFGTFQRNDIGFGTIIGSAVFNVLFVIAMCSLFARETLALTWWPLFRDSFCYAIGLVVLSIFVGVNSKEVIELWEAIVLFIMYFIYVLIMWKNAAIYKYLTGKELEYPEEETDKMRDDDGEEPPTPIVIPIERATTTSNGQVGNTDSTVTTSATANAEEVSKGKNDKRNGLVKEASLSSNSARSGRSTRSAGSVMSAANLSHLQHNLLHNNQFDFRWQGTFRAGILKLMRNPQSWVETGGVGIVAKIAGDADQIFRQIDENGDGEIDKEELKKLFQVLGCRVSEDDLDQVFDELDVEKTGAINEKEFNRWYTSSTELVKSQVRHVFDSLDVDNSGTIDKMELMALLVQLDPQVTDSDVDAAVEEMYQHGSREEITFEEFSDWYEKSIIFEKQKARVEEDMEGAFESLKPPFGGGWGAWLQYMVVFPLVLVMVFTIPDVRVPGRGKWCYLSFFLSVGWIGGFSYLMVTWAEIIGNTAGIPPVVMGLTVLAAGTSVPDLLSSVIVARRGSGDMAVSSSIGSNIFDILVGLPLPWILFTAWPSTPDVILIGSDNIFLSLFVLLGMLVFVIAAVHCQGWKLTKTLGAMMIVFYFGFLAMAIVQELPFETCI